MEQTEMNAGIIKEEWECPIGLTAEHAIGIDDDSDEGDRSIDGSLINLNYDDDEKELGLKKRTAKTITSNNSMNWRSPTISTGSDDLKSTSHPPEKKVEDGEITINHVGGNLNDEVREDFLEGDYDALGKHNERYDFVNPKNGNYSGIFGKSDSQFFVGNDNTQCTLSKDFNPFASFAFERAIGGVTPSTVLSKSKLAMEIESAKPKLKPTSRIKSSSRKENNTAVCESQEENHKRKSGVSQFPIPDCNSYKLHKKSPSLILASEKRERAESKGTYAPTESVEECIAKWHSFADHTAPIEYQRFQVMIAARLHARCHENSVKKAMEGLRSFFERKCHASSFDRLDCKGDLRDRNECPTQNRINTQTPSPCAASKNITQQQYNGLTPQNLALSNPESEIAPILASILFGNTKARQIVQASQDILHKFHGEVPESMASLKEITGIGPKLAEILHLVNRRKLYGL